MDFIDLHIHTTASDGSLSPKEVVHKALEIGLYAMAITDHDTVSAVAPAMHAAEGLPLHVISGVEISSHWMGKEIHILGYNFDHENEFLVDTLSDLAILRYERNEKMCELLRQNGIDITMRELQEKSHCSVINRVVMGRLMVEKGYVQDIHEAFSKYLGGNCPCYIPKFTISAEDAYKLITYAGGVCSLAHPVQYKLTDDGYIQLFKFIKDIGFKCIEAFHSDNKPGDTERFSSLASSVGLGITGGSDFHGLSKPDIFIGTGKGNIMVPKNLLKNIGIIDF